MHQPQLPRSLQHVLLFLALLQASAALLFLASAACNLANSSLATCLSAQLYLYACERHAARTGIFRRWWKRPRAGDFWLLLVNKRWEDSAERDREYRNAFRMSHAAFERLCECLRPVLQRDVASLNVRREMLDVRHIVGCVLYRLASGDHLYSVSNMFGLARGTISVLTREVCQAINNVLRPSLIHLPSDNNVQAVVDGFFEKSGLPNCFGAVDGTHIELDMKPVHFPGSYWSQYKQAHTIVMQAVVDSNGRFLDIDVRWPGRTNDATIFRASRFYQYFPLLYHNRRRLINGVSVPLYVVGDSAYPLSAFCLKKYVAGPVAQDNQNAAYDLAVTRARVVVENAFSRFKGRWSCMKRLRVAATYAAEVTSACAVLHNYVEVFDPDSPVAFVEPELPNPNDINLEVEGSGAAVRDAVRWYMQHVERR